MLTRWFLRLASCSPVVHFGVGALSPVSQTYEAFISRPGWDEQSGFDVQSIPTAGAQVHRKESQASQMEIDSGGRDAIDQEFDEATAMLFAECHIPAQ